MVRLVRAGQLDMIGAARPSIADPFLPKKIEEGRLEDIRECIGCNICVSGDFTFSPIRCTQNPTMGEEWRKGWHPERIPPAPTSRKMLVVGSGPSGLECALALARRGHEVMLAEADKELGGRVIKEPRLPGLAEWGRVRDYRVVQLQRMSNVDIYPGNALTAADVFALDAAHVVLATGAGWRRDGIGRNQYEAIPGADRGCVYTPDDIHIGLEVTLVTPATLVSQWTVNTMEQERIQGRLLQLGVRLILSHSLVAIGDGDVSLSCSFTGARRQVASIAVVLVTSREPNDVLYQELTAREAELADTGIQGITRIGDCLAPSTIAAALYAGHRFAREFESPPAEGVPFRMERRPILD